MCYLVLDSLLHTGALPKDEEAASCLWAYRKGRQNNGSGNADMVSADGGAMLNEMKDIREKVYEDL